MPPFARIEPALFIPYTAGPGFTRSIGILGKDSGGVIPVEPRRVSLLNLPELNAQRREAFLSALQLPMHKQPSLKHFDFAQQSFPNAERIAEHGLRLPVCPTLKEGDIEYVVTALRAFFGN